MDPSEQTGPAGTPRGARVPEIVITAAAEQAAEAQAGPFGVTPGGSGQCPPSTSSGIQRPRRAVLSPLRVDCPPQEAAADDRKPKSPTGFVYVSSPQYSASLSGDRSPGGHPHIQAFLIPDFARLSPTAAAARENVQQQPAAAPAAQMQTASLGQPTPAVATGTNQRGGNASSWMEEMPEDEQIPLLQLADDCVDDIEAISKQVLYCLLIKQTAPKLGDLQLFERKLDRLRALLRQKEEYKERAELISKLQKCVENRDEIIQARIDNLGGAEQVLTKAVYQAGNKLKAFQESQANAVYSEDVLKFACQMIRTAYAPKYWTLDDPARPFPTEAMLASVAWPTASRAQPGSGLATSPSQHATATPTRVAAQRHLVPQTAGITFSGDGGHASGFSAWRGPAVFPFPQMNSSGDDQRADVPLIFHHKAGGASGSNSEDEN